ncbi:MAG: 16S rRNA (uracil(1498)-N(3))-methyltransferase [Pseudomonadota bacterium]
MHRFYITPDAIQGNQARISGQDARHLAKVLRLCVRDRVELADGQGKIFVAEITAMTPKEACLALLEETTPEKESRVHIAVAQALIKEARMDDLIRPLTELGINQWIPFAAGRSVPVPDPARVQSRRERWERIAREAIKQCGRTRIPEIHTPVSFDRILSLAGDYDLRVAFWERATCPVSSLRDREKPPPDRILILIGPEGGFSGQEIRMAETHGFRSFSLGPRILRAETATLTAVVLMQNLFGDLG